MIMTKGEAFMVGMIIGVTGSMVLLYVIGTI